MIRGDIGDNIETLCTEDTAVWRHRQLSLKTCQGCATALVRLQRESAEHRGQPVIAGDGSDTVLEKAGSIISQLSCISCTSLDGNLQLSDLETLHRKSLQVELADDGACQ
jgi:hypothetical protein